MSILVWSTLLYLLGVAVVLLLRPTLMFRRDGAWKEFGIQLDDDTTPFPFWMFCVTWAIVSYFIIRIGFSQEMVVSAGVAATLPQKTILRVPETIEAYEEAEELMPLPPLPAKKKGGAASPAPGYYMMKGGKKNMAGNIPHYIYIGPNAPGEEDAD